MRIVGEDDVRAEEDVVLDDAVLEEAAGMDANPVTDAVAVLERRVRPDGDVVAEHVALADESSVPRVEAALRSSCPRTRRCVT